MNVNGPVGVAAVAIGATATNNVARTTATSAPYRSRPRPDRATVRPEEDELERICFLRVRTRDTLTSVWWPLMSVLPLPTTPRGMAAGCPQPPTYQSRRSAEASERRPGSAEASPARSLG